MADLTDFSAGLVVTSIVEFYEKREVAEPAYLDAATLGAQCERAIWYAFRGCVERQTSGLNERLASADRAAKRHLMFDLREIGVELLDRNEENGQRFFFGDHGGHVGSAMDAAVHRVPSGGDQWHVLELATLSAEMFVELKRCGVKATCGERYDRMQMLMGWTGMPRTLFLAESRTDASLFAERVPFDPVYFERLRARAQSIIFSAEPPERLYEDPTEPTCMSCPSHYACHGMRVPAVSCRTCCYSTPELDGAGRWSCIHPAVPRDSIPLDEQRIGCAEHVHLPFLIAYADVVDAGDTGWIVFRRRDTGRHFVVASASAMPPAAMFEAFEAPALYHSAEIAAAVDHRAIGNAAVEQIRRDFDGRVAG